MPGDPSVAKAIRTSVISSIIVLVFIKPILNLTWQLILLSGERLSDGIYRNAALGQRNYIDVVLLTFVLAAIFGTTMGRVSYLLFLKKQPAAAPEEEEKKKKERLLKLTSSTPFRLVIAAVAVLVTFGTLFLLNLAYTDLQLNTSFRQRLTVLAPHISDQENKEFLASWAAMRSRKDYELIVAKMEQEARIHNVTLPESLIK
jgi:hypothetical protein